MESSFASKQFWLQKTRLVTDLDAHLSSAEYVQKVIQQEIRALPDVNCSTSFRVSSHDTTYRSTSPAIDDNTNSISPNSDNQETNDWQECTNTPVLTDSVLNSNCFVATDDSASADMTRHNDADLLDLPGHQTSLTLLSRTNASAGWMFKGTNISALFMVFQQKSEEEESIVVVEEIFTNTEKLNIIQIGNNIGSDTTRKYYLKDLVQKTIKNTQPVALLTQNPEFHNHILDLLVSENPDFEHILASTAPHLYSAGSRQEISH
ncbi:hypothetical protein RMCBS344292_17322 [Rhizopus microsporus]|nr:hypothetical protein RMCBS344292_17322 [Rhizopus microsporus]